MMGVVLAGGRSARFGSNKALAKYRGISMLERSIRLLKSIDVRPVIMGLVSLDQNFEHSKVLEDDKPFLGPLGGVCTAMKHYPSASLLFLTCDMPALTASILIHLMLNHKKKNGVTLYQNDSQLQPFPGIYESRLYPLFKKKIDQGKYSMRGALESLSSVQTLRLGGPQETFLNVNTPQDIKH